MTPDLDESLWSDLALGVGIGIALSIGLRRWIDDRIANALGFYAVFLTMAVTSGSIRTLVDDAPADAQSGLLLAIGVTVLLFPMLTDLLDFLHFRRRRAMAAVLSLPPSILLYFGLGETGVVRIVLFGSTGVLSLLIFVAWLRFRVGGRDGFGATGSP